MNEEEHKAKIRKLVEKKFEDNVFRYDCRICGHIIEHSNELGLCNRCMSIILNDNTHIGYD